MKEINSTTPSPSLVRRGVSTVTQVVCTPLLIKEGPGVVEKLNFLPGLFQCGRGQKCSPTPTLLAYYPLKRCLTFVLITCISARPCIRGFSIPITLPMSLGELAPLSFTAASINSPNSASLKGCGI